MLDREPLAKMECSCGNPSLPNIFHRKYGPCDKPGHDDDEGVVIMSRTKDGHVVYDHKADEDCRVSEDTPVMLAAKSERARIEFKINEWLNTPTMLLRTGEITAQEIRTVKAVLNAILRDINENRLA